MFFACIFGLNQWKEQSISKINLIKLSSQTNNFLLSIHVHLFYTDKILCTKLYIDDNIRMKINNEIPFVNYYNTTN